ncbi:hypothetical protein EVAR_22805_1 [Eumeta japonica]|uniref:Secreted protein n=1 Tax=Eumeta variegata TaxID=151549 RepID=A0A4C1VHW9_EUMVA|nr:hypothetical protein EVAR_22805_1 [Eumeta japonica]
MLQVTVFAFCIELRFAVPTPPILPSARNFDTARYLSDDGQPRRTHASAPCNLNLHANKYPESLARTWNASGAEALLHSAACRNGQFYSSGRSCALCSRIVSKYLI